MYSNVLLRRKNKWRGNRKKKRGLCTLRFPYHKKIKRDKSLRDGPVENKYLGGRGKEEGGGKNIKNAHARQVAQGEKKNPRYFLSCPALTGKKGCSG